MNMFTKWLWHSLRTAQAIQEKNLQMMAAKSYRGMGSYDSRTANIRYNILRSDNATLYHKFSRHLGVNTRKEPQYNIDNWLNPDHRDFKPEIQAAVFYYQARVERDDRFKVCITTEEMDKAALKYVHHSQLIVDGTFGVCSRRLLLFIAMGVDEERKGLPVALFLFSAPTGNRATHAGYNTKILTELFFAWNRHLSTKFKISFEPYSALTDTDTKERGALLAVWKSVILLICKFHLRQCWTNNRKKLRCKGSEGMKGAVTARLYQLENRLIATTEHAAARALIEEERTFYSHLAEKEETRSMAEAALKHLTYILEYWMPENMWQSWSSRGRHAASARIGIPVDDMIPTTNHLESFNSVLKRKFIGSWLRTGRRLRVDLLIYILIARILPDIFARRLSRLEHRTWLTERFQAHGADLVSIQQQNSDRIVAWWPEDESRQKSAQKLASEGGLASLTHPHPDDYTAVCSSSTKPDVFYTLSIQRSGRASCSCPDFQKKGGACKHLRAMRLVLDALVLAGHERAFNFPSTQLEAIQIELSMPATNSIDLPALQAIGDDNTMLGDDLGDNILGAESAGTNVEGDGDVEDGSGNSEDSEDDGDKESDTEREEMSGLVSSPLNLIQATLLLPPHGNQQAAVEQQIHNKLYMELGFLLPRIHGVDNLLSDITTSPADSSHLDELYNVAQSITEHILLIRSHPSTKSAPDLQPTTSSSSTGNIDVASERGCRTPPPKRQRRTLLPPSPEKQQIRKSSNGTL
ncbi:hypothetical protein EV361DRAFT_872715 [Lentinula raphanica]|nr:hypothetical protein EV361DRAFT_872715 [Lentinula raphanica]